MSRDLNADEIRLDPAVIDPRNNVGLDADHDGKITVQEWTHYQAGRQPGAGGLGDYDDILMLTVRNEHEPFVGGCRRTCATANEPTVRRR